MALAGTAPYHFDGSNWTQEQKLTGTNSNIQDTYGIDVSISGDFAIVGAHAYNAFGNDDGAAFVYRYDGNTWVEDERLTASDNTSGGKHNYGIGVSIDGNVAIVGAQGDDSVAGGDAGSAYIYRYDGADWIEEQKLVANDASASDSFGVSVSVDGNLAIVGAKGVNHVGGNFDGAAYIFRYDGISWSQEDKIVADDAFADLGFGHAVSISGNVAVVGALGPTDTISAAYVFRKVGDDWVQETKLTGFDTIPGDTFGRDVSISGNTIVVGAQTDDTDAGVNAGSAYVFRYDGTTWVETVKLTASDGEASDQFGGTVSVDGDRVAVGATMDDTIESGGAYVFDSLSGNDELYGGDGDDFLSGGPGADTLAGGDGDDTAVFSGAMSGYNISTSGNSFIVNNTAPLSNGDDGTDTLTGIETLQFSDGDIAITEGVNFTEFQVNTFTADDQKTVSVADLGDGGFVSVWRSFGQDGDNLGIFGQRFEADGTPVLKVDGTPDEFQVNTTTANAQDLNAGSRTVAGLADGGFVVVWSSFQDGSGIDVFGQRFNPDGTKVLKIDGETPDEFQVNTTTANSQEAQNVVALGDGGFVVVWNSEGSSGGIFGQRFDASGNKVDDEFQVNTTISVATATHNSSAPRLAALNDGGFVVTWSDLSGADGSGVGIFGQRFNPDGTKVLKADGTPNEFQVNTFTADDQDGSTVAALTDGFVVAWFSKDPLINDNDGGIAVQFFDGDGNKVGGEFLVNTSTAGIQAHASVATLEDGDIIVTWSSFGGQDGSGNGVFGQRINVAGTTVGDEFQINTFTDGTQEHPSVTALPDGGFLVAWESVGQDGSGRGVYAQRFDSNGNKTALPTLTGDPGDNVINAGSGDQVVDGGDGDDVLSGGAGNDLLNGGVGDDTLIGDTGATAETKLTASDGVPGDFMGIDVTIEGDWAMVGAHAGADAPTGYAYVFHWDGTGWAEHQKLTASDAASGDSFGGDVSISGDWAIISATHNDDAGTQSGSAYMYQFDGTDWVEHEKLTASDGASQNFFGVGATISSDVAIVGANGHQGEVGAAYIYRFDGSSWGNDVTKLENPDPAGSDRFGITSTISGDLAVIGADLDDEAGSNAGAAYVYRWDGIDWNLEQKLIASDAAANDRLTAR